MWSGAAGSSRGPKLRKVGRAEKQPVGGNAFLSAHRTPFEIETRVAENVDGGSIFGTFEPESCVLTG
jgi:hypothetical protein